MKKNIFFLIILATITLSSIVNVKAANTNFYEAEYIPGIWMNKSPQGSNTIYYQKARFFRQVGTNNFAYCIEPFSFFNQNETYQSTITPNNLTTQQKEKISLIAHFGYGYKNHTDQKWYAITQFMIWQTADPTGDYYFTDKLNGNRINIFQDEIQQINNLINQYQTLPSIANKTYTMIEDNPLTIKDNNNVLNNYQVIDNNYLSISNNNITISNSKEGTYQFSLKRQDNIYNKPIIFYQANNSQNLVEAGDIDDKIINFTIKVIPTSLTITKIDSNTKSTNASGEGQLEGAIYELYDNAMNKIDTLTIDKDMKSTIKNLNYGKYYIKEKQAGTGYLLDQTLYTFEITEEHTTVDLILENKIIEKKIVITKLYGEGEIFLPEKNIHFNIYNQKNELIKTIITNENGIAEIKLPYGNYKIVQQTTTEGYNKISPLHIEVKEETPIEYTLKDYKIAVPNTKTTTNNTNSNIILTLIKFLKELLHI